MYNNIYYYIKSLNLKVNSFNYVNYYRFTCNNKEVNKT